MSKEARSSVMRLFGQADGSQWIFASGLVLALAGNLAIRALAPVPRPGNALYLLGAGGLLFTASLCFALVGWMLQQFEAVAKTGADRAIRVNEKDRLVDAAVGRLLVLTVCGLASAGGGIAVLVLQPKAAGVGGLG
jgi:hypothetical protein